MQAKQLIFLIDTQEVTLKDPQIHGTLINILTILLLNELIAESSPTDSLIDGFLAMLLDHLTANKDGPVLGVTLDCFWAFIQNYQYFTRFGMV
jgi:hypothetical protein